MKCMGDFGGISYNAGDYHTPGTSGLSGISYKTGDFVTPGTSGLGALADNAKSFVSDHKVSILVVAIAIIGYMALNDKKKV
jgi:hypothetical protein